MKWLPANGGVQKSADGKYSIVRATQEPEIWIAYAISPFKNVGEELPPPKSCAADAREICEDFECQMESLRKRA